MPKFSDVGLEGLNRKDWEPDGIPYGSTDDDDPKSGRIQFRIKTNWLRMSQEMIQDPQSPYFGVFVTPSDLWRHIVIRGLIAMGEKAPNVKDEIIALRLKEHALQRTAAKRTRRARIDDATETVIRQIDEDVRGGDITSAAEYLDAHLGSIIDLKDDQLIKEYATALYTHPAFSQLRKNKMLITTSKLMTDMEANSG